MSVQEPLIPGPPRPAGQTGIWSWLKDTDGAIDAKAWTHHRDTKQHVGRCSCGQPLHPGEPYKVGPRDAYPAVCAGPGRHEVVAYGPQLAKKKIRN